MGERLIVVSNRLPVTVSFRGSDVELKPSVGGLATGMAGLKQSHDMVWVGWPGFPSKPADARQAAAEKRLRSDGYEPVMLGRRDLASFYADVSNAILWPLFHLMPAHLPLEMTGWEGYVRVNELYAERIAAIYQPGDIIWVHDYHLMLLPRLLRERLPDAAIGFFLHIPFPSSEVFRMLPWRDDVVEGLLGADLVAFHTSLYASNFATSVLRTTGIDFKYDALDWKGRQVRLLALPLGVDVDAFEGPLAAAEANKWDAALAGRKLLLAVDRLDYTKGLPRRLLAVEQLLERNPSLRGKLVFVQIAVPSRTEVVAYDQIKRQTEELVGRINGRFGEPGYQPIHYVSRAFTQEELVPLYRRAEVMLVTPLRDGMNLVAKEFCASRVDDDGVLVLSEFAGAAAELGESLKVNPYDVAGVAEAIEQALEMPADERRQRMKSLRHRLREMSSQVWSRTFVDKLRETRQESAVQGVPKLVGPTRLAEQLGERPTALLLDYDGTMVPIVRVPDLARPDAALIGTLQRLAQKPDMRIAIVSGRSREFLDRWFDGMDVDLFAEHAMWHKPRGHTWHALGRIDQPWREKVSEVFERYARETPGSMVEVKESAIVWHYRMVDPELGITKARALHFELKELLANAPAQVSSGKCIIEVKGTDYDKGTAVRALRADLGDDWRFVALGDDTTDEDMFGALEPDDLAVRVGVGPGAASYALADVTAVRRWLELVEHVRQ